MTSQVFKVIVLSPRGHYVHCADIEKAVGNLEFVDSVDVLEDD
jgi:hypothetical protein